MVDKDKIEKVLNQYFHVFGSASINNDGVVDIQGDIETRDNGPINKFPLKFDNISGYFYCSHNDLTSLEGSPNRVGESFSCTNNPLVSLKGMPEYIGGKIRISYSPKLPLLRLLIPKRGVEFPTPRDNYVYVQKIQKVLNQFAGQGKAGVLKCSHALLTLEKELQKEDTSISLRANIKW